MKLNFTKSYNVTFQVICYEQTEGGMNIHRYGNELETLEEAILAKEAANNTCAHGIDDWTIEVHDSVEIRKHKN